MPHGEDGLLYWEKVTSHNVTPADHMSVLESNLCADASVDADSSVYAIILITLTTPRVIDQPTSGAAHKYATPHRSDG